MSLLNIAKLERLPLREVWKHEARDFTQWLEENFDVLNSSLNLNLVSVDREQPAGAFSVDLVGQDDGGGTVIIENQLEKSDHDHLGKLITYLTGMSARAAIWIVAHPRPEHVTAVAWLNESSSADFYMVKVEAVRIDDSPAAPLFTLIVGPSDESRELGKTKKKIAERYGIRKRWWTMLIERSAALNNLHAHITPGEYNWIGVSSGFRGLNLNYVVRQNECGVELYIDRGKGADAKNQQVFDQLHSQRQDIETAFDGPLEWDALEGKRACVVKVTRENGGWRSPEESWPEIQDSIITTMGRFEQALRPFLKLLKDT
jgi:hypothetical protein